MEHSYFKPLKFIKKIIKIISLKNIPLVIKQHPKCNNDELKNLLNKYCKKGKIILYNGSIHDAISKATTIYTINSGVGFEALLHLKPVITFGKSDYMSMSKNIDNLDKIKKEPFYYLNKSSKKQIKKFICFYIKKRSLFLDDEKGIENFIYKIIKSKMIEG
jgi:capsule polysaccharide export protein KpsC/LpsZ